ncbi:hypothetical protein LIER_34414 [Lithospermum erythrorhizon]|uniref:Uncharacterized protein n=1 Tax=Lithospermum erythrorhizon TaxID=34254 RepID=A0AAV3S3N4_LITER
MDCIILPVSALRRRYSQSWGSRRRLSYQPLADEDSNYYGGDEGVVVVVGVGEDKREFIVDPFVLQEDPFRILMDMVISKEGGGGENKKSKLKNGGGKRKVIFVDVDAILFEHMLWLMQNDESSLLQLNIKEIVDFYS